MKIALDPWVLDVYAYNVFRHLWEMADGKNGLDFRLLTAPDSQNYGRERFPQKTGFSCEPTSLLRHYRLWRLGGASIAAHRVDADVLFAPSFQVVPVGTTPVVTTIHDATPVLSPAWNSRTLKASTRFFMAAATRFSKAIVTASECSKNDLIEVYGLPPAKIHVVYLGHNQEIFNTAKADQQAIKACREKFGIGRDYILHHGFIQPRKNLIRLVQAYRELMSRRPEIELDLVLAGRIGWESEPLLAEVAKTNQGKSKVIFTKETSEGELGLLVKGAALEMIPSLYEGFCLPMIEAMASGTPTIAARTSCLPEVSGGVLEYFDPLSVEEICTSMQRVLENKELQARLSQQGAEHAQKLTWKKCADQTLKIITEAGGNA
jgi:glycosyltransferase involved in cell wall biosynthesis